MKKRRLRIIMFAAMVAVVGCKTRTAFYYAERVYHAEGHWPKESTDEGGMWTLDFYASRKYGARPHKPLDFIGLRGV